MPEAPSRHGVAAVVPVLDEAEAIGPVVTGLVRAGACCVYVVDGGSTDGTAAVAAAAGSVVLVELRRGYGRACRSGIEAALGVREHGAVALLDGDGSCDPADLPRLLAELPSADLVLGRREPDRREPGALARHARLGNLLVLGLLRLRTGRRVDDLAPFKVARRELLVLLGPDEPRFGWTVQLIARSLRDPAIRIVEVPVGFRVRRGGRSKVSGSLGASLRAGFEMIGTALRETRREAVAHRVPRRRSEP